MSLTLDLVAHLKNDTEVSALVGGKIYPLLAPQNVSNPYIVYHVISDNSNQCISGDINQNEARFQIDVWSTKYSEVEAIKEAVISALIGFKSSNSISAMDDYESETKLYRKIIDFKIKG